MADQQTSQQDEQLFTPAEVAELIGESVHNVRRWIGYHRVHLSPGARPEGPRTVGAAGPLGELTRNSDALVVVLGRSRIAPHGLRFRSALFTPFVKQKARCETPGRGDMIEWL